jgi:hypothetical protein
MPSSSRPGKTRAISATRVWRGGTERKVAQTPTRLETALVHETMPYFWIWRFSDETTHTPAGLERGPPLLR